MPLYAIAGAICLLVALPLARPLALPPAREFLIVIGLAVIPTILGHSILNNAMRHLRGQIVSVVNLFQFLFAGALAYFLYDEAPRPVFYAAGALVVGGAIVVIHAMAATPKANGLQKLPRRRRFRAGLLGEAPPSGQFDFGF